MPNKKPLFFDTVVLSNFAFVDNGIAFLQKRYQKRGHITLQVLEELAKASFSGITRLETIEKQLLFTQTQLAQSEQSIYLSLLRNLGDGEASCIACSLQREGIVVTDDRMARAICKERSIPVTGTLGILKAAYLDGLLPIEEADAILKTMIDFGFYSPVQRISDTL